MTIYQLIDILQKLAKMQPNVRTTSEGDIYRTMNNNPQTEYDVVHIMQNTHQHLEYLDRYNLTLFYVSRLVDDLESNRVQCQSIGKEVLNNIITDFCDMYELDFPTYTVQVFTEKFIDLCAGCYVNLTFEIPADACADDFSEIINIYQTKTVDLVENGQFIVLPDSNYPALDKVIINVDVKCSGCTEEELQEMYDSGYTEGYNDGLADCGSDYDEGYADGIAYQKSLLVNTAITTNGTYSREDGYNSIVVNVPQSGHTDQELEESYQSGITYQKSLLSGIYITENGQYNRIDGYSSVTVNVPQSGYTQEDLDNAYNRGFEDGLDTCAGSGYATDYLTIEALSGGVLSWAATTGSNKKTIEYSKNGGEWTSVTSSYGGQTVTTVQAGDLVRIRGLNETYCDTKNRNHFKTDFNFNVYGNIMSMIYGDNFRNRYTLTGEHTLCSIFLNCNYLISAENLVLPATALTYSCYQSMFAGCTSLTTAPALPATNLVTGCYYEMFAGCTSLTTAPALPATTLATNCYDSMFRDCTSLVNAPVLPATNMKTGCYETMFSACTSLTTAPSLPATTLADSCYREMFENCTSLNYIKCLATDISAYRCTYNWVIGVQTTAGTFLKDANTTWTTGDSGIPTGWTVIDNN